MISKSKVNININTSLVDYFYDIPNKYILDSNMMMAFSTSVIGTNKAVSEVSFKFTQNNLVYNETTGNKDLILEDISLTTWNSSMFHPEIYRQFGSDIDKSNCPTNKRDMYLKGSTNAQEYSYITIDVYKELWASCLTMDDFIDKIKYIQLRVFIQSSYADFKDVDNAIIMKGSYKFLNLNLGSFTSLGLKISENDYSIENSYFFTSFNKGSFYSLSTSDTSSYTNRVKTDAGLLGQVLIKLEDFKTGYDVKIYTFYDFLAQLGGIYEIIFECLGIIGFYLTRKIYEHSLVMSMTSVHRKINNLPEESEDDKKKSMPQNAKENAKNFYEAFQNNQNLTNLNWNRKKNKKDYGKSYVLNYKSSHLMRVIMCPARFCNKGGVVKRYLADIDQLKIDISLENIMESLANLKDQVNKINLNKRSMIYENENKEI